MDHAHISELSPELAAIESKQFRATVTLIWPYSSSTRQFALLLAEPELRLRRKNGQVRARFSGASAKAIATAGVGIGDEVVLSLRGAEFVKEGAVSTPGKSIEWELSYTQTVVIRVYRNGSETANLELVDAAPTPAPGSPVRPAALTPAREFSSPAFFKRARLSDGPSFQVPYDPLADETEDGHDRKRHRKSYGDWKAWTYSARTPSPEKEDVNMDEELESVEASPSRAGQLPRTPVSPQRRAGPLPVQEDEDTEPNTPTDEGAGVVGESPAGPTKNADSYDLYTGPDEHVPSDAQYAFGGDTEIDTEVNTEEEGNTRDELNATSTSTTEADIEEQEDGPLERVQAHVVEMQAVTGKDRMSSTHEASSEFVESHLGTEPVPAVGADNHTNNELTIAMPPPAFPSVAAGLLTPIGREPASPTLAPQDASNLPLPSPFPGEHDADAASYFGVATTTEQPVEADATEDKEDPPSEASYIGETSFFSSIGSSRASVFHPNHESAFTPVRFTFGMDGAGYSRPMELSSPPPEARPIEEKAENIDIPTSPAAREHSDDDMEAEHISQSRPSTPQSDDTDEEVENLSTANPEMVRDETVEPEVVELSSEDEEEALSEIEPDSMAVDSTMQPNTSQQPEEDSNVSDDMQSVTRSLEDTRGQALHTDTQRSTATSAIVDLGSPPDDNSEIDTRHDQQQPSSSRRQSPSHDRSPAMDLGNHSEFVNLDFATADAHALDRSKGRTVTHTKSQEPEPEVVPRPMEEPFSPVGDLPESTLEATDDYLQDAFPMEHASFGQEHDQIAAFEDDRQSDVHMETIEEAAVFQPDEFNDHLAPVNTAQTANEPVSQYPGIEPEDAHQTESMSLVLEPPARNTRSKAKASAPLKKEDAAVPEVNKRSKRSVTSRARSAVSPPRTRTHSALSPSQESIQTSPYSLRSQSRLSPMESLSTGASIARQRGSRRHASQRSVDSIPDIEVSQTQEYDRIVSSFQPSQELGASQGRYSDVVSVKDSEEESARSEHSMSTVHPSDMEYMHHSDPVGRANAFDDENDEGSKPPSATAPELRPSRQKARGKKNAQQVVEIRSSSPAQPEPPYVTQSLISSPGTQRHTTRSKDTITPSPRNVRRTRRKVYDLPGGGSQDVGDIDELMRSSPPVSPKVDQRTRQQGKRPITPVASQQTAMVSQPTINAHHEQNTLLTPQLTQTTSAGLCSFQADAEVDMEAVTASSEPKTTPRRKHRSTDATTIPASPTLIDPSSEDANTNTPEPPSVGLSTPLAYYTPLKDLIYFLNRSSDFHSAANPDILALVTSPTTSSEKAKKGPKHWFTSVQITDSSSWPETTTVQIFRAYQNALPEAQVGDVILLRAFAVKSLNRHPMLISTDESAWCVWRWGKPVWGAKRGVFGELRAREETKGPAVEKGAGEWREVEKLRGWFIAKVETELAEKEEARVRTRSKDKGKEPADVDA
ncbi:hypothetical protein J4E91_003365 [Alternaria rosae]|nr:hypothetical protein J4E91_003365 [Alternaria rosae]